MKKHLSAPQFRAAANHVFNLTQRKEGANVAYDPSDSLQAEFMQQLAGLHGYTPDRYPALFNRLRTSSAPAPQKMVMTVAAGDGNTGAFVDNQIVDYITALANGNASAHAIITRTKPIASTFVAINVVNVNGDSRTVVASGASQSFMQQTTEVRTNDQLAIKLPTTGQNYSTTSWSIEYTDGQIDASSTTSQWAYQTVADPDITAPRINPDRHTGNLKNIMVGLSRGFNSPSNNTDIDYWFWQDQWQNSTLLVPLIGSMFFSKPIAPLSPSNPLLFFYLARTEGGMVELKTSDTQPYMSGFSIDPTKNNQLNFSLQATDKTGGNAINFGTSPWVADTQTFFTARIVVTLNDGTLAWSSVLSSTNPDTNPTDGVKYIPPLIYLWHCLAAGTQVAMADGTTQSIENLNVPMTVRSAGGTTQNVQATLAQPHWGTVYVITTQGGLSLTCSGTHPMVTPTGPVQASTLTVGATVITANGNDTVSSITQQQQSGQGLFNIWLDGPAGQTTFYANGFLVGDYQMQVALLPSNNPAVVRERLPAHLRQDYDSHLQDLSLA